MLEMWQRVLVTGCAGYLGRSLMPILREQISQGRIFGTSRRVEVSGLKTILDEYAPADLSSQDEAMRLVEAAHPDLVIHLASLRTGTLEQLLRANVVATDNLLRSVRAIGGSDVRVVVVGSSAEIGFCRDEDLPLAEGARCEPVDDYGISKLSQSFLARLAHFSHGQSVVRVRPFNLLGPQLPATLLPGRCVELLRTKTSDGHKPKLSFGNLNTRRDYTDVRDVSRGILLAARYGRSGALYHLGSGRAFSGREVIAALAAAADIEVECETEENPGPRSEGVPVQVADARLAEREISWSPGIAFERSIEDMWRCAQDDVRA